MKNSRVISFIFASLLGGSLIGALPALAVAGTVIERLEASVNSGLIMKSDARKFKDLMQLRGQLDPLFSGTALAQKGKSVSSDEIVEFLISEKLILQAFPITDAEVEQEINNIQSNNKIDRNQLKSALRDQGFSFEDYFDLIRISASKRNLIDRDIRTRVTITDDDIKNYYYNHYTQSSSVPRAYHFKIITVSPKNFKTPAAAREAITRASQALKSGESFEEVAKRVSDDPSASAGGDLGILTEDQMSPMIRDQLKKLPIGQSSDVLGSASSTFFILKLLDVKSSEGERFEKVKEEIRNQLAAAEYQHQIQLWLERQRQNAFIHKAGEPSVKGFRGKT